MFSTYWILLGTAGNAGNFAKYVLQLSYPTLAIKQFDERWINIMDIAVQGIICLALYFARPTCFLLNNVFAMFKVILLVVLSVAGFIATRHQQSGTNDYSRRQPDFDGFDALGGMIHVLYTYEGWEYTNFVSDAA